jgi:alanine racemase
MTQTRREFLAASASVLIAPKLNARRTVSPPFQGYDPWIEVDAAALRFNLGQIRRLCARPVLAVVKNNAYGLGLVQAARVLEPESGISGFAVVRTAEAIALRDAGVRKPILLMARAADNDILELIERNIEFAIFADDDVARLRERAGIRSVGVQFYVDSGMGRMGVPYHRALPLLQQARDARSLNVRGMFTELAEDAIFDLEQLRRFRELGEKAKAANLPTGPLHAASSHGVYHLTAGCFDQVRTGMALYGGYPDEAAVEKAKAELHVAVRLRARVARVEQLRAGDSVSYGRNYIASKPTWIATLPVGHADGYPRAAVKGAHVLIGSNTYPVIGAVSASHCIVELGDEQRVRIGDVATLMGPDHPTIHPNAIANTIGAGVYDLFMHLSPSLPRTVIP